MMNSLSILSKLRDNKIVDVIGLDLDAAQKIIQRYAEPHRFYHGLNHLFGLFDDIHSDDRHFTYLEQCYLQIIALFHDAIYDPRLKENEKRSAELFLATISNPDCPEAQNIHQAIIETDYGIYKTPSSNEGYLFKQLDYIDPLFYRNYPEMIRDSLLVFKEYQCYPYPVCVKGRMEFIEDVLCGDVDGSDDRDIGLIELKNFLGSYRPKIGVYAGSFKPFHAGHLNILEQAEKIFDKVIILAAQNPAKAEVKFDSDWVSELRKALPFHEVVIWDKLTTAYLDEVREYADVTLVRGLRNGNDLQYEENLRRFMEDMGECDVAYFLSGLAHQHVSSSDMRALRPFSEEAYQRHLCHKYDYAEQIKE
jgi:pantetheine-phosphate adenylyltransferase